LLGTSQRLTSLSRLKSVNVAATFIPVSDTINDHVQGRRCSAAGKVTAGLAESNGSLPPGGWLAVTCGLTACTPGSAPGPTLGIEYEKPLPFISGLGLGSTAVQARTRAGGNASTHAHRHTHRPTERQMGYLNVGWGTQPRQVLSYKGLVGRYVQRFKKRKWENMYVYIQHKTTKPLENRNELSEH